MGDITISINQLADFIKATENKKLRIIKEQKKANTFKIAYYQLAKGSIKKTLANQGVRDHVNRAMDILIKKKPEKKRQISDRIVSLEALQRFTSYRVPRILSLPGITFLNQKDYNNRMTIEDVNIIVAPDLIYTVCIDGKEILGGIKLHVSKSGAFDLQQQQFIASGIFQYLKTNVAQADQSVDPEWCISLDIFGNGYVPVSLSNADLILRDPDIYKEIKLLWNAA